MVDVLGICVGHLYYFLEDVYPLMLPSRKRLLQTPHLLTLLFHTQDDAAPPQPQLQPLPPAADQPLQGGEGGEADGAGEREGEVEGEEEGELGEHPPLIAEEELQRLVGGGGAAAERRPAGRAEAERREEAQRLQMMEGRAGAGD